MEHDDDEDPDDVDDDGEWLTNEAGKTQIPFDPEADHEEGELSI